MARPTKVEIPEGKMVISSDDEDVVIGLEGASLMVLTEDGKKTSYVTVGIFHQEGSSIYLEVLSRRKLL